jgi:O-antigen ligase
MFIRDESVSFRYRLSVQIILVGIIVFFTQRLLTEKKSFKLIVTSLFVYIGSTWCIIFSQDRSVWVATMIALFCFIVVNAMVQKGTKKILSIAIPIFILALGLFTFLFLLPLISEEYDFILSIVKNRFFTIFSSKYDLAYNMRLEIRSVAINHFKSNPIFGVGFTGNWSHDIYYRILAQSGIVGAIVWSMLFITMIYYKIYIFFNLKHIKNDYIKNFSISQIAVLPAWFAIFYVEPVLWHDQAAAIVFFLGAVIDYRVIQDIKKDKILLSETYEKQEY